MASLGEVVRGPLESSTDEKRNALDVGEDKAESQLSTTSHLPLLSDPLRCGVPTTYFYYHRDTHGHAFLTVMSQRPSNREPE